MKAIILAIGNELTSGQSVDTNSAWIALRLATRGIETVAHATVADDQDAIAEAIAGAARQADVVVISGGLGPTPDDLTRQALAQAMGAPLEQDDRCLEQIEAFFRERHREMIPENRIQAMVPAGARAIENPRGTAPGLDADLHGARVFVTPGVPHEMRGMMEQYVLPALPQSGAVLHETVRLFGTGESDFAARLKDLLTRTGPVVVGTTVAAGLVSLRITSQADTPDAARAAADAVIAEVCARLGTMVVGIGEDASIERALGEALSAAGQTLATAESCTGGLIGQMLTDVSGSSAYYLGGVVSYANAAKTALLGVDERLLAEHGAVSRPVAEAMARGVRARLSADWGIATTGIAGPTGGTEAKPVGLVYTALAGPSENCLVSEHRLPGNRTIVRLRTALAAMNALRLRLLEE